MIAFSPNERQFFTRMQNEDARISDDCLWARWIPCDGLEVETWLLPRNPWHIRVDRIELAAVRIRRVRLQIERVHM